MNEEKEREEKEREEKEREDNEKGNMIRINKRMETLGEQ